MTMNPNDPAFPTDVETNVMGLPMQGATRNSGMSIRAYMATQILAGMMGEPSETKIAGYQVADKIGEGVTKFKAKLALEYADALLAELDKETK